MITGTDLVEWQLRVAAGEKLPIVDQALIQPRGHAFEARIYAEDCSNPAAFMPTAGSIKYMRTPELDEHVRIDTGVVEGDDISVHYDPLIAKLVVWSHDRSSALRKLTMALKSYHIAGLPTNIAFLQSLSTHPAFLDGLVHTDFIKQHTASLFVDRKPGNRDFCVAAAVIAIIDRECPIVSESSEDRFSPFANGLPAFRVNHNALYKTKLRHNSVDAEISVETDSQSQAFIVSANGNSAEKMKISGVLVKHQGTMVIRLDIDDMQSEVAVFRDGLDVHMFEDGRHAVFSHNVDDLAIGANTAAAVTGDGSLFGTSPMPGVIEKIFVKVGQQVAKGDSLLTLIAMKMEYIVRAGADGVVHSVNAAEGDTVAKSAHLVELRPLG